MACREKNKDSFSTCRTWEHYERDKAKYGVPPLDVLTVDTSISQAENLEKIIDFLKLKAARFYQRTAFLFISLTLLKFGSLSVINYLTAEILKSKRNLKQITQLFSDPRLKFRFDEKKNKTAAAGSQ